MWGHRAENTPNRQRPASGRPAVSFLRPLARRTSRFEQVDPCAHNVPVMGTTSGVSRSLTDHWNRTWPSNMPSQSATQLVFQAGHASSILVTRSTAKGPRNKESLAVGLDPLYAADRAVLSTCYSGSAFSLSTTWLSRAAISHARRSVACWYISAAAIVEWPIRCISSRVDAPL